MFGDTEFDATAVTGRAQGAWNELEESQEGFLEEAVSKQRAWLSREEEGRVL